jgi:hypothetical protein
MNCARYKIKVTRQGGIEMTTIQNRSLASMLLAAALAMCTAEVGCAGRVRIYDTEHRDYHAWDGREDRAYRSYLGERHENYREYGKLDRDQQSDYWKWRHDHPDADDRR